MCWDTSARGGVCEQHGDVVGGHGREVGTALRTWAHSRAAVPGASSAVGSQGADRPGYLHGARLGLIKTEAGQRGDEMAQGNVNGLQSFLPGWAESSTWIRG